MRRLVFLALLTLSGPGTMFSQVFISPQPGMKSHPTLDILKVEAGPESTVIYFTIENRIPEGSFCIDENTFIVYPDGSRMKARTISGIPVCPDVHRFLSSGEKLNFNLTFPPLKTGTGWIDIVEDCDQDCVWFYGLILDNELNNRLEQTFSAASVSAPEENIKVFSSILENIGSKNMGIAGLLYINIINAAIETGNSDEAATWYMRLSLSNIPHVQHYLKYLNDTGIKF